MRPAAALLVLLAGCGPLGELRDAVEESALAFVPRSVDEAVGDRSFERIAAQKRFVEDAAVRSRLEALAEPLVRVARKDAPFPFRIHVPAEPTVNAFALPGGHVLLPAGFLRFCESPREAAGVLAHELAHVTERHGMERAITSVGLRLGLELLLGEGGGVVEYLVGQGASLLLLKYSRDQEREADRVGHRYLVEAGLDPRGLPGFFERLEARGGEEGGVLPAELEGVLGTHPVTAERIERLRRLSERSELAGGGRAPLPPEEWAALQRALPAGRADAALR